MKMTLTKANSYKRGVVASIKDLEKSVNESTSEKDWQKYVAARSVRVNHLINVKMAISSASSEIQRQILECAEAIAEIGWLSMPISEPKNVTEKYNVERQKAERAHKIKAFKARIEDLRISMDAFENDNFVEFEV